MTTHTRPIARQPRRRAGVRLALLCALVLVLTGLGSVPAAGDEYDTPVLSDPYVQYGMSGCRTVDNFNDRCPSMVSEPLIPDAGESNVKTALLASPDGSMLYALGIGEANGSREVTITAFHADPNGGTTDGTVAWERNFRGASVASEPVYREGVLSHDGDRLYVGGFDMAGSMENWVASFDTSTGDTVWATVLPAADKEKGHGFLPALAISPDDRQIFVSNGVVYQTGAETGPIQNIRHSALDAGTGDVEWQTDWTGHYPNWPGVSNSLAVSPDSSLLYSQINPQRMTQWRSGVDSGGSVVAAIDTSTGETVWDSTHTVPVEDGPQNPPWGLALSPDGSRVISVFRHEFNGNSAEATGHFDLISHDARTGHVAWSKEYSGNEGTGCDGENWVDFPLSAVKVLAFSPSGETVYLLGKTDYRHPDALDGGCGSRRTGSPSRSSFSATLFAVDVGSGDLRWEEHFGMDGGQSCDASCGIAGVVPGPSKGDIGSQVLIATSYLPDDIGRSGRSYPWTLAVDGVTGEVLWQGRYLDTYNDGQSFFLYGTGRSVTLSPDGSRLYRVVKEYSETRGWNGVNQVLGYDLDRDFSDLIPTSITVSPSEGGSKGTSRREVTVTVANDGSVDATGVVVRFFNGDRVLGDAAPADIAAGESVTVSYLWTSKGGGKRHQLNAVVNPDQSVAESDYGNNRISDNGDG